MKRSYSTHGSPETTRATIQLVIDKSDYTLELFYQDSLLKTYPVVFGFNPTDDKLRQGDGCTPEGEFGIRDLYPHGKWKYFIWIDYPNEESWSKHNAAKASGKIPSSSQIGGEVGIHGVPEGLDEVVDQRQNWTLGCISLKNEDVAELFPFLGKTSMVSIRK